MRLHCNGVELEIGLHALQPYSKHVFKRYRVSWNRWLGNTDWTFIDTDGLASVLEEGHHENQHTRWGGEGRRSAAETFV